MDYKLALAIKMLKESGLAMKAIAVGLKMPYALVRKYVKLTNLDMAALMLERGGTKPPRETEPPKGGKK